MALWASANVGVYVIGSAFKELDGNLVAGAKTWILQTHMEVGTCTNSGGPVSCPGSNGSCVTLGSINVVNGCACQGSFGIPGGKLLNGVYQCNP